MARVLLHRDVEVTALTRQVDAVRAGAGRLIVVEGAAGIGKSSLLAATARESTARGVRVLRAWGGPLEAEAGWGIARQLFAALRGDQPWTGAAALARRALDADGAEPALTGDAMHAAAHGLTWLACGLADQGAVLLVIDDVHWADAPSLRWLVQLARQLADLPLGLLCAVRAGEPPAEPELLAELLACAGPPVRPRPLDTTAVETIVADRFPEAAPGFAAACHAATAGNPFLLGALLDHLAAEGVPPTEQAGRRLGGFGPDQVARGIDRQLARLPAGTKELARAFAVLGRATPLRHAGDLASLDAGRAAARADDLVAAGLLGRDDDRYALVHPLVAAALYGGMPAGERGRWHARAAAMLDADGADPEAVSLHLLRTQPNRDTGTVTALCDAARRAELRGAPDSAASFLRRALAEPPAGRVAEAEVRSRLGLVLAARMRPDAAELLAEAVCLAGDPGQRSRIALAAGQALGLAGHFDAAARLCHRGLDEPAAVPDDVRERLEAELVTNAWMHADGVAEARERLRRAAAGSPLRHQLDAWQAFCDGRPVALDQLQPDDVSVAGTSARVMMIACGHLDEARRHSTGLIDLARPRGWLIALAHGSFVRSMASVRAGRVREAEADACLALEVKRAVCPPAALMWTVFPLVEALTERNEPDAAEAVLASVPEPVPGALATPLLLQARARLRLAQHRPADAFDDLTAAADNWKLLDIRHPGLAAWRADACHALTALGSAADARRLAEEHLDLAERAALPPARAAALRAMAAATPAEAVPLLRRAAGILAARPERLEHVRTLVDLGAALRRANHRAEARAPLAQALDLAHRDGMALLAERARHELRAAGARPRRAAAWGAASLTAAEHQVASLAARGLTNPEIAQQLYVTRRTVETHLTHVFQKLGVTGRAGLAGRFVPKTAQEAAG
jgi:DNA-binding NarL/FixJ family response regulator